VLLSAGRKQYAAGLESSWSQAGQNASGYALRTSEPDPTGIYGNLSGSKKSADSHADYSASGRSNPVLAVGYDRDSCPLAFGRGAALHVQGSRLAIDPLEHVAGIHANMIAFRHFWRGLRVR
jgi:hypothetical protein